MNTINKTTEKEDVKINVKMKLSALWAALMFIYIYADILQQFMPGKIEKAMEGFMGPFPVTQGCVVISRNIDDDSCMLWFSYPLTLKPKVQIAGQTSSSAYCIRLSISSNLIGETWAFLCIFCKRRNCAALVLIVGYAWKWRNPEGQPVYQSARAN